MIDAVVTWVDGADAAHFKKREAYRKNSAVALDQEAALSTRFASRGEIDFCLRALLAFAPWLRKIFIVTDGQTPAVLKHFENTPHAARFEVIDHQTIFPKNIADCLPVFNSLSIESMLWRIPDLSAQFIYLNDDCFLLRPMQPSDFFDSGRVVLRGQWKTQTHHQLKNKLKRCLGMPVLMPPHRIYQENSARLAGFKKTFWHLPHAPFPLLKQTFVDCFQEHPTWLTDNAQHAFRQTTQFWPMSLAYHLNIKKNQYVLDKQLSVLSVNPAHHSAQKIHQKLNRATHSEHTSFACMQSLDAASDDLYQTLYHWLSEAIPS